MVYHLLYTQENRAKVDSATHNLGHFDSQLRLVPSSVLTCDQCIQSNFTQHLIVIISNRHTILRVTHQEHRTQSAKHAPQPHPHCLSLSSDSLQPSDQFINQSRTYQSTMYQRIRPSEQHCMVISADSWPTASPSPPAKMSKIKVIQSIRN